MNYLIQRGKGRNQMINVPNGLPELLSDITREVLRCQPTTECLCQFIIDYLHSVIVTREKARVAKGIIDRTLAVVEEIIADMCVCDISKDKAQEMALHMEQCFRRFLTRMRCEQRRDIEIVNFNESDMLDVLIERCKFTEQELKISKPIIEAAYRRFVDAYMKAHEEIEGNEGLYQYFKERERRRHKSEKENSAAIKIQANFRGYKVRKVFNIVTKPTEDELNEELFDVQNQAAQTIQRTMRRYMSSLETQKSQKEPEQCKPGSDIKVIIPGSAEELIVELEEQELQEEEIPVEIEYETFIDTEADINLEPDIATDYQQDPVLMEPETKIDQSEPPPENGTETVVEGAPEETVPNEDETLTGV